MDFDSIFGAASTMAKHFEARWLVDLNHKQQPSSNSSRNKDEDKLNTERSISKSSASNGALSIVPKMPFQRRNLLYNGTGISDWKSLTTMPMKSQQSSTISKPLSPNIMESSPQNSCDLLKLIWNHTRVRCFSDAFPSPSALSRRRLDTNQSDNQTASSNEFSNLSRNRTKPNPLKARPPIQTKVLSVDIPSQVGFFPYFNEPNNSPGHQKVPCSPPENIQRPSCDSPEIDQIAETFLWHQQTLFLRPATPPPPPTLHRKQSPTPPTNTTIVPPEAKNLGGIVSDLEESTVVASILPCRPKSHSKSVENQKNAVFYCPLYNNDIPIESLFTWNSIPNNKQLEDFDYPQHDITTVNSERSQVLYHFLYMDEERQICVQTDTTQVAFPGYRRCIFCFFDGGSDAGLIIHCMACHGDLLSFHAARSENGTLHIAVTSKSTTAAIDAEYVPKGYKVKDFVMCRRRIATTSGRCIPTVPTVKRQWPSLSGRRKKPKTDNNGDTSMPENTNDQYPIRQYYHSRSYEPMMLGEWDFDSDDQEDDDWLTRIGDELIDEFEDVMEQEKIFVKLWNHFMKSHIAIADSFVPQACFQFLETYFPTLAQHNLRQELMLHFSGLWDHGLISSTHFVNLMATFDKMADEQPQAIERISLDG